MANENLPEDDDTIVEEHEEGSVVLNDQGEEVTEDSHAEGHQDDDAVEHESLSEDERESIRERRRQERKDKKQAQRDREDTLKRERDAARHEMSQLQARLAIIERKTTGSELSQLDNAIRQAHEAATYFENQIALATQQNDGVGIANGVKQMLAAQQKAQELSNVKNAYQRQQSTPAQVDPALKELGSRFLQKHGWLDMQGKDPDSTIALAIDRSLEQEGWNPKTPQYWEEFDNRINKYLPHRTSKTTMTSSKSESRKSVVTGSGRESSSATPGAFRLSPERVQALKESGDWDDPVRRAKMVKAYRDHDTTNKR